MVIVDILLATICFSYQGSEQCHHALVGYDTPRGEFVLQQLQTDQRGYGGDILQFSEDDSGIFAIHRVYLLNPKERRAERLRSQDPNQRRTITKGCINVDPAVYAKLIECCSKSTLLIK